MRRLWNLLFPTPTRQAKSLTGSKPGSTLSTSNSNWED
jgi:hypothetical protein